MTTGQLRLVAELNGRVVGFITAHLTPPLEDHDRQFVVEVGEMRLQVDALAVERDSWRRGVGATLLTAAERWGADQGATLTCLDTYIDSPVSVPFYEHEGYERRSINYRKRLS